MGLAPGCRRRTLWRLAFSKHRSRILGCQIVPTRLNFKSCATGKPACFRLACISRGSGRKRGVANKIPRSLKLAVIDAAAAFGSDGKGNAGLTGYLFFLAGSHPQAFAGLLGKTLPYQINTIRRRLSERLTSATIRTLMIPATIGSKRRRPGADVEDDR